MPQIQIKTGDTLSGLATQYKTDINSLLKANPQITDPNKIFAGASLNLPYAQPGAGVQSTTPAPTVPAVPTVPVNLNPSPSFNSTSLMAAPKTPFDIQKLVDENTKLRETYLSSLQPTQAETDINTQLVDLRKEADDFNLSLEKGKQQEYDNPFGAPLSIATGRAQELERQAGFKKQELANKEKLLLSRLGLEQEARKTKAEGTKTALGFNQDDIGLAVKMQEQITKQEEAVLARAEKLSDNARQTFSTVLDKFKGLDFEDLPVATQTQLATLAGQAGIPIDALVQGMKAVKDQQLFENAKALKQLDISQQRANVTVINSGLPHQSFQNIDGQVQQVLTDKQGNVIGMTPLGQSSTAYNKSTDATAAFSSANTLLDQIETQAKKVITASNFATATLQAIKLNTGALTGADQNAKLYNDTINAFTSQLARASGEKGILTDQDVARIRKALPGFGDTAENRDKKITQLKDIFKGIQEGVTGAYAPNSSTNKTTEAKLSDEEAYKLYLKIKSAK